MNDAKMGIKSLRLVLRGAVNLAFEMSLLRRGMLKLVWCWACCVCVWLGWDGDEPGDDDEDRVGSLDIHCLLCGVADGQ